MTSAATTAIAEQTELDKFEVPRGVEPIHPFDVYDMLVLGANVIDILNAKRPDPVDEMDYIRNRHKLGQLIIINGKRYFETTSVPYRSTSFKELPPPRETADNTPACPV